MSKEFEGNIPEQESGKRLKTHDSSGNAVGYVKAPPVDRPIQSGAQAGNLALLIPTYTLPPQFFSSLTSASGMLQPDFYLDVKVELQDLGFKQEDIFSMFALQNISCAILCMETLTQTPNLITLQVLINELKFDAFQISIMLHKGYLRIRQLNDCLEDIRELVNKNVLPQDITNMLEGYKSRKSPGFKVGLKELAKKYEIELPDLHPEVEPKASSSDLSRYKKAKACLDFDVKLKLDELGFTQKNIISMLTSPTIGAVIKCMDTLIQPANLEVLEVIINELNFEPCQVSSMLHNGYNRIEQLKFCINSIRELVNNKIPLQDITRVLVGYSSQKSGGFVAGIKKLAEEYSVELSDFVLEAKSLATPSLSLTESIDAAPFDKIKSARITEKTFLKDVEIEVETASIESKEGIAVAENSGSTNSSIIDSITVIASSPPRFFTSTAALSEKASKLPSESLALSSVIVGNKGAQCSEIDTSEMFIEQNGEGDSDECEMAKWGMISSFNILPGVFCLASSPQPKNSEEMPESFDDCNAQQKSGFHSPSNPSFEGDEEFALFTSEPTMLFGGLGESEVIFEEISILRHGKF